MKPRIALALGDPAGIGPEIVARLLSREENRAAADILLVADRGELEEGMRIAGVRFDYSLAEEGGRPSFAPGVPVLLDYRGAAQPPFERAVATANGGRYALDTLRRAAELTVAGVTDGMCFAPLNKHGLHLAGIGHSDETHWFAEILRANGPVGEINTLDGLWTSRVTSHVPLKDVSSLITEERILDAIRLVHGTLIRAGVEAPRIAVCGLNPHNGENGSFGREELDVIGPTVEKARALGLPVVGMYPADTIFLKAKEVDAIVTMYHDQGQIAMKLMGFSRGVTVHGGMPIPIATPAHGTGYDIYGQGKANVGAIQAAFDVVRALASAPRASAPASAKDSVHG
ncbi:4-hydroxythreonine-4-phosphate dehydrogenase [Ancylobacter novellus DSM 506]|uniref:4-hydroxythreonine-4-phosphate dehydrogenase n=1 Tax=Ancylobacter novellus (strain ATCC 8093 / DSM 506 / JCM 20403 / CCM 1077 / IAM 12100 / NBRC 12443 / NCIMB 10456) TaxID=639283 RepID=D7AAP8_ANCN5|nr:4-hydroxythreonine-4-phosphate dehydrogenase PdxA [Ancylobacter novellus]ADH90915.1 4-hydroxythreonine-4-phosphate dehydrogenase [Ancylobacter novellus DSM 506]